MLALRYWFARLTILWILLGVILLSLGYNRFLLDRNLRNLKSSLLVLNASTGVGQAEAALLMVDQTLLSEMAKGELDLKALTTLQYAQGTLASDEAERPVADAQIMVDSWTQTRGSSRAAVLSTFDAMAGGVQTFMDRIRLFPRQMAGRPSSREIDSALLRSAVQSERQGRWQEAQAAYERMIREYPNYVGRVGLKLRLGYLYSRLNQMDRARSLFRQALAETRSLQEAQVARQLLGSVPVARQLDRKAAALERRLLAIRGGVERQRVAFELGSILIQRNALERASKAFRQAAEAAPQGEWAMPSLFKEAWCLRTTGRFDEALERLLEIIGRDPKGGWGSAAYHQIAQAYAARGDYPRAAETYERLIQESRDNALAAIVHAQAAGTYLYDLGNPAKAKSHFKELSDHYPASPFGPAGRQLENLQIKKGFPFEFPEQPLPQTDAMNQPLQPAPAAAPSSSFLAEGSPLVKWLERFLPNFADVFGDQLARYMKGAGITKLTRRFTETEFQELVVRRVQSKFPGQLSNIQAKIRPDGYTGGGIVHLGPLSIPVEARIGIQVVKERPHAVVHEIKVGNLLFPEPLLKSLESGVNLTIDQNPYALKIKKYELKYGEALISVELSSDAGPGVGIPTSSPASSQEDSGVLKTSEPD